jgi:APA family basic amino acid/polyamine antiporter
LLLAARSLPTVRPSGRPAGLGAALVPILFTYGGWQQTNFIAEEIVDPERNLPRALLWGVAIVVTVYLLTNVAYLRVLGIEGLAHSTAPAADTMEALLGPAGGKVIAAGIAISTFGFLNLVILVTPRVLQAMAADGVFFRSFAVLHPAYRTPTLAIVTLAIVAVLLTLTGTFDKLVDFVTFGDWIFFGLTAAALFVYRQRDQSSTPGFRVPAYPVTVVIFVLAAAYVVFSSIVSNPGNAAIGAGLIGLGVPAFLYWRSRA